jgi:hypothetical protein
VNTPIVFRSEAEELLDDIAIFSWNRFEDYILEFFSLYNKRMTKAILTKLTGEIIGMHLSLH